MMNYSENNENIDIVENKTDNLIIDTQIISFNKDFFLGYYFGQKASLLKLGMSSTDIMNNMELLIMKEDIILERIESHRKEHREDIMRIEKKIDEIKTDLYDISKDITVINENKSSRLRIGERIFILVSQFISIAIAALIFFLLTKPS